LFYSRTPTSDQFENGITEVRSPATEKKTTCAFFPGSSEGIGTEIQSTKVPYGTRKRTNGPGLKTDADTSQDMVPK